MLAIRLLRWFPVNSRFSRPHSGEAGYSLIDVMITCMMIGIVCAMAVPGVRDMTSGMRLAQGARDVERELQTARLKSVTTNRPMRVRLNCPAAGQFRMVELIGTSATPDTADGTTGRCSSTTYPYPPTDRNPLTRPNNDGPLRQLPTGVTFSGSASPTLEFWPDGTVHKQAAAENPWSVLPTTGTAITVTKGSTTKSVTINGLGKIQLQ